MAGKLILGGGNETVSDTVLMPARYSTNFDPILIRLPMRSGTLMIREEEAENDSRKGFVPINRPVIQLGQVFMNLAQHTIYELILTQNVNEVSIVGEMSGDVSNWFQLVIKQDSVGNRQFVSPSNWKFPKNDGIYKPSSHKFSTDLLEGLSLDNGQTWLVTYCRDIG